MLSLTLPFTPVPVPAPAHDLVSVSVAGAAPAQDATPGLVRSGSLNSYIDTLTETLEVYHLVPSAMGEKKGAEEGEEGYVGPAQQSCRTDVQNQVANRSKSLCARRETHESDEGQETPAACEIQQLESRPPTNNEAGDHAMTKDRWGVEVTDQCDAEHKGALGNSFSGSIPLRKRRESESKVQGQLCAEQSELMMRVGGGLYEQSWRDERSVASMPVMDSTRVTLMSSKGVKTAVVMSNAEKMDTKHCQSASSQIVKAEDALSSVMCERVVFKDGSFIGVEQKQAVGSDSLSPILKFMYQPSFDLKAELSNCPSRGPVLLNEAARDFAKVDVCVQRECVLRDPLWAQATKRLGYHDEDLIPLVAQMIVCRMLEEDSMSQRDRPLRRDVAKRKDAIKDVLFQKYPQFKLIIGGSNKSRKGMGDPTQIPEEKKKMPRVNSAKGTAKFTWTLNDEESADEQSTDLNKGSDKKFPDSGLRTGGSECDSSPLT